MGDEKDAEKRTAAASNAVLQRRVQTRQVSRQGRPARAPVRTGPWLLRTGPWGRPMWLEVCRGIFEWGIIIIVCILAVEYWTGVYSTTERCVLVQLLTAVFQDFSAT